MVARALRRCRHSVRKAQTRPVARSAAADGALCSETRLVPRRRSRVRRDAARPRSTICTQISASATSRSAMRRNYTDINRNIGNQAALIAGFAYSGIRYHYLVERQHSWQLSDGDSLEEVVFTSLLTMAMGCGLQTVLIAMLVAMLGPSLALRGGDGALHDAVKGMQAWTSAVLVLFLLSLFLLQARTTSTLFTLRARARNPPTLLTSPARAARSCRRSRSPSAIRRWAPSRAAPSPPPSPSRSSRRFGRPSSRSQSFGCRRRRAAAQFGAIRRNSALHGASRAHVLEASPRARASGGDHGRVPLR